MAVPLDRLTDQPVYFADCCAGISWPLLNVLATRLPQHPATVLSIGCGSGLLESLLLLASDCNVYGVDVLPCVNRHLPPDRLLRVPCTNSLHPEAWLASSLMFVYPRAPSLIFRYLDSFLDGALERVVWLGFRDDWQAVQKVLQHFSLVVEVHEGPGMSQHELLVFATVPRRCTVKLADDSR
ncbi:hypothetical protein LTR53_008008 [Teratosphaeriaceae sp. CCFEE 6253]|nr:hypothetical protein LTR53_008008 [Teratosphaeriaceae sp. CCFEE 6253]